MKKQFIVLISLIISFTLLVSCSDNLDNKVDDSALIEASADECIDKLEERAASEFGLEGYELISITVDILEVPNSEDCYISIKGSYDADNEEAISSKSFDITRHDFDLLYSVNKGSVLYNAKATELHDEIITDIPAWAINGVYNIMFE